MKIKELYNWAKEELVAVPVSEPESSAEFLLRQVLGVDRAKYYTIFNQPLTIDQIKKYRKYIERRKKHEPVWQIVGKVEFWGMDFFVNQNVLVPRPETELLVEIVLQQITNNKLSLDFTRDLRQITKKSQTLPTLRSESRLSDDKYKESVGEKPNTPNLKPLTLLDVGTGAGTIVIALAKELSPAIPTGAEESLKKSQKGISRQARNDKIRVVATDISAEALKIAKKNAQANGVADIIRFIQTDLFEPVVSRKYQVSGFDIVTANLPYVPHEDMSGLALDIHHYEPRVSLDGGPGGLVIYERFLKELSNHLNPGGMAFCEIGKDQGERFKKLVKKYLPETKTQIKKDLAGIDRIVIVET